MIALFPGLLLSLVGLVGWQAGRRRTPVVDRLPAPVVAAAGPGSVMGLAELVDELVRHLRSGASWHQAMRRVAPADPEGIGRVADELDRGRRLDDALDAWRRRDERPGVAELVAAVRIGHRWGGSVAQAVAQVADGIRDRQELADEGRAQASQARTSAWFVAAVPLPFVALNLVGGAESATFLFTEPLGWACLAGGVGLDVIALLWMKRWIDATVRR